MDVEKRIRTNESKEERTVSESHLKVQVDTQTQFLLPAVPKLTKRGQPGANSCSAGGVTEASRTIFQYSSVQQHLLPVSSASW